MAELRIGDADREAAVALLGEQYALGRLTKEEFDERSDAAWSARTGSDLAPLFADLPVASPGQAVTVVASDVRQRPWDRRTGFPVPWVPVVFVLVGLTVLTHLPLVLILLGLWFFLGRRHWSSWPRRWDGGSRYSAGARR